MNGMNDFIKTIVEEYFNENDNSNNIIAYHGTRYKFDTFEPSYPRMAAGNPKGVYFTRNLSDATEYAQDVYGALDKYSRVIKAKLTIDSDLDGKIINHSYSGEEIIMYNTNKIEILDYNVLEK